MNYESLLAACLVGKLVDGGGPIAANAAAKKPANSLLPPPSAAGSLLPPPSGAGSLLPPLGTLRQPGSFKGNEIILLFESHFDHFVLCYLRLGYVRV